MLLDQYVRSEQTVRGIVNNIELNTNVERDYMICEPNGEPVESNGSRGNRHIL